MTLFSELDDLLGSDVSEDYWSDDLVLLARETIERLTDEDWRSLEAIWTQRPAQWQHRFADVISRGSPARSVPLLITMIESGDDELSLAAANSLSAIAAQAHVTPLTPEARTRLAALSSRSELNKRVIENLLERLTRAARDA